MTNVINNTNNNSNKRELTIINNNLTTQIREVDMTNTIKLSSSLEFFNTNHFPTSESYAKMEELPSSGVYMNYYNAYGITPEVQALFSRLSKKAHDEMLDDPRGIELLELAHKYNIPLKEECVNWLKLMDQIDEYEDLIDRCTELNIDWDFREYDPIALKQEIELYEERAIASERAIRSDYYASCMGA